MPEISDILKGAIEQGASDVLLVPNEPPVVRIDGALRKLNGASALAPAECKRLIYSIMNPRQVALFEKSSELDFPYAVPGLTRFRVNVYLQHQGVACALRAHAAFIPTPEQISLGPSVIKLAELPRGLVLVAGPTGSGKTTTLAALIEHINQKYRKHIIAIEDPIEFVYQNKNSIIDQREVGTHTASFAQALRSSLRENPDIIFIGEMRDLETIELAIKAAETGHLCLSTLHTRDAPSTIDRIVTEFPAAQQPKIRLQLSSVLAGVISQVLIPKKGGGRICAREVMLMNPSVATLIRDGKLHQIFGAIEAGKAEGMSSMDQALADLILKNLIEVNTAWDWAHDISSLQNLLSNIGTIMAG